ncbi:hypothetical protein CspHIS471_0403600 [Cutaneotrichosporon sp. HIS471]|nr:hypothetical protein CspHIS471_0403600 [Cutaneotrichosporon sp. HIS471]
MREPSPEVDAPQVFGTLHFLKRKTGETVSHIPLDGTRLTIGRERECDIRLYFEDVSKLHAEIIFDEDSGLANLVVHGNNGLIYTPAGGAGKHYYPPSVLTLGDTDTLQIRKKLFRFYYGDISASSYHSPAKTPGRRLSHRLSIVPQGKRFAPSPAKSRLATPGRMAHVGTVEEEEEEEEEDEPLVFEELVGLANGEDGDKIYLEKRDDDVGPKNPFMTPQPKGRAPLRNTSAVPRTRTITFVLPDKSQLERHTPTEEDSVSDENEISEEEDMEALEEGVYEDGDEGIDDDVPAPATPTPSSIPLPDVTPMGGPRRQLASPRAAYSTPRGAGSDALRRALLIRSARKRIEAETETVEPEVEVVPNHFEGRRRRSSGRTLSPPQPDSESSEEDEDKENTPLQWVYEDGQGGLDDSDSDRDSLDTEYSIPGARILDFDASPDPGSPSESEGSAEGDFGSESGEESDERSQDYSVDERSHEEYSADEREYDHGYEAGDISSDIDDEVDRSLVCPPEEVERSPSPVLYTPPVYAGARMSLAGIGPPMRFEDQPSPVNEHLPTGMRIPPTPSRLGKPVRPCTPKKAEPSKAEDAVVAPVTPPPTTTPATPPPQTPAKTCRTGLTPAQRAQLATPLAFPTAPASFRDAPTRPIETPRRTFLDTILSSSKKGVKNTVSFIPETPNTGFGTLRKRMPTPRVDRIAEVDVPATPTSAEDVARMLYPQSPTEPQTQPLQTEPNIPHTQPTPHTQPIPHTQPTPSPGQHRRRSSLAGIRDLLKSKKPTTLGLEDLIEPKKSSGIRDMFRASTPPLNGVREMLSDRAVPPTPQMDLAHVFPHPVPPTPRMELADMFPEPELELEEEPRTRSLPTRAPRTELAKVSIKPKTRAKEPESAPVRNTRRTAKASEPRSAPTRRVTRSQTVELEEPELEVETKATRRVTRSQTDELEVEAQVETKSAPAIREVAEPKSAIWPESKSAPTRPDKPAPTRRSRRVLGEAEPVKEPPAKVSKATKAPKAAPKLAVPARSTKTRTRNTPSEDKDKIGKTGVDVDVGNKENSATPDPEPKRKTALPVRITRSRKAKV